MLANGNFSVCYIECKRERGRGDALFPGSMRARRCSLLREETLAGSLSLSGHGESRLGHGRRAAAHGEIIQIDRGCGVCMCVYSFAGYACG